MDALDAIGERNMELVAQINPEQWNDPTPCPDWSVRAQVGQLIAGRYVYRGLLDGASAAELRPMMERQSEAVGNDAVAACESAVRSIREAFAAPGALERTVRHRIGDMPGNELLIQLIADCVLHSWDLATAIGVRAGLDERSSSSPASSMYEGCRTTPCMRTAGQAAGKATTPRRHVFGATRPSRRSLTAQCVLPGDVGKAMQVADSDRTYELPPLWGP